MRRSTAVNVRNSVESSTVGSARCGRESSRAPGVLLSCAAVLLSVNPRSHRHPAEAASSSVQVFSPFPETLQKPRSFHRLQLGFSIYHVSNEEKVRRSKNKKEWCPPPHPPLCCGLRGLLLGYMCTGSYVCMLTSRQPVQPGEGTLPMNPIRGQRFPYVC